MSRRIIHMSVDTEGALRNAKDWRGCITVEGKKLNTVAEVRAFLQDQLAQGHKVLPTSDECEGFDWEKGCPGHVVEEEVK